MPDDYRSDMDNWLIYDSRESMYYYRLDITNYTRISSSWWNREVGPLHDTWIQENDINVDGAHERGWDTTIRQALEAAVYVPVQIEWSNDWIEEPQESRVDRWNLSWHSLRRRVELSNIPQRSERNNNRIGRGLCVLRQQRPRCVRTCACRQPRAEAQAPQQEFTVTSVNSAPWLNSDIVTPGYISTLITAWEDYVAEPEG